MVETILYTGPRAKVKINERFSEYFPLFRGTRQGCPLSPLFFALTVEPLAIAIRTAGNIGGFRRGVNEEKILLYADDVLFLGEANYSLTTAMDIIKIFGQISGLFY